MATITHASRLEAGRWIFTRIVVGVDGSQQALEAARQSALLEDVDGQLTLFAAWDIAPTIVGGTGSEVPYYYDEDLQRSHAENAVRTARDYVDLYSAATTMLVRGAPTAALLEEIDRNEDTLVAVGSGRPRLLGIVEGSVTAEIIHRAPCSVLIARPAQDGFPRRIVVGVDGSAESAAAYAAARYAAERFDATLSTVVAGAGKRVDKRLVAAITDGRHDDSPLPPVEALTAAARGADLVVVGSRGLHGVRSLGSVSERVAHSAACSVLVVRTPAWQRVAEELGR